MLIELLVVIAIIGVLSAVVLASLNTARNKGNDAAIQSDLATIQTQSEIVYGNSSNSYDSVCTDSTVLRAIAGAEAANGSGSVTCNDSATAYAVSSSLSSVSTRYWCIDSTGGSSNSTTALAALTVCPASN